MSSERITFKEDEIKNFKEKFSKSMQGFTEKEKLLFSEILSQDIDIREYDFTNAREIKIPVKSKFSFLFKRDHSQIIRGDEPNQWNWKIWAWKFGRPKPKTPKPLWLDEE
jgi:hypothetical protein